MSCSNCFNGCTEITSDKCVRYTGADIPALGIQNGDTLQFVEQALAQFLISALDGSGIKPAIDPSIICSAVSANLPTCGEFTIIDLISGLIKSVCDLQEQIDVIIVDIQEINSVLAELNDFYDIPSSCFTGVTIDAESTHSVLQALLDRFCALVISLPNTYVALNGPGGIQDIITQALEAEGLIGGTTTKQYTKMIPYVAYPWFAPSSYFTGKFDINGAGLTGGEFENVYLCNGVAPGVPDLRGRVLAGLTTGMGGGAMDVEVSPSTVGNPNYQATPSFTKTGVNFVTLGVNEMPQHKHIVTIVDNKHSHFTTALGGGPKVYPPTSTTPILYNADYGDTGSYRFSGTTGALATVGLSSLSESNISVSLADSGESQSHDNTQPTIGCYYIMYIPA